MTIDNNEQLNTASLVTTKARCLLIDIEGTTSSIEFVYDVLFPFAKKELRTYLSEHWQTAEVQQAVQYLAKDLGFDSIQDWSSGSPKSRMDDDLLGKLAHVDELDADPAAQKHKGSENQKSECAHSEPRKLDDNYQQELVVAEVERLMEKDVKSTGLKELQGLIWAKGYAEGYLSSHVFADVPVALKIWHEADIDVRIFSSGSINAQKVFFKHTECGDLSKYLRGHYDTKTGPKRETETYKLIAKDVGLEPKQILFLSDVEAELEAARAAGMQVALVVRPGNAPVDREAFATIETFDQISIV